MKHSRGLHAQLQPQLVSMAAGFKDVSGIVLLSAPLVYAPLRPNHWQRFLP